MRVVSRIVPGGDILKAEKTELCLGPTCRGIDREQDRPGNDAADEADDGGYSEEAEQEIAIDGLMVQDIGIGDLEEGPDPIEQPARDGRSAFPTFVLVVLSNEEYRAFKAYCSRRVGR